mgnify:CR=1 FL=1
MANILLLEPAYKNKYPPLGLMKIAAFHKNVMHDKVFFSKGPIREGLTDITTWDKVYVTTLFTFEWKRSIEMIEYAKTLVPINKIVVGGIASTLMPDEYEKETGIRPITGLLNESGKLGYPSDETIDSITPDYTILDDIASYYHYPYENAYFMYSTRGCGMNCGFCAVKTLEPTYIPFISIKEQIRKIDAASTSPKKDLLLMDNNVLKSCNFEQIINELIELGFGKNAIYINPKTKRTQRRYIDFNQGLDAYLLNDPKAALLSQIAIKPARIAFDHIEDKDVYVKAIKTCARHKINTLSNYVLYNADAFTGKGHSYAADTPQDLYERLQLNVALAQEINAKKTDTEEKISIFSFPMRYIPLDSKERGYISKNWNAKYLRAIQVILIPTQGKVGTSASFFYTAFGKNVDEYMMILDMPEYIISLRGEYKKIASLSEEANSNRFIQYQNNQKIINEWISLYSSLSADELYELQTIIHKNKFTKELILNTRNPFIVKLLLFYMPVSELLKLFDYFDNYECRFHKEIVTNYCNHQFPAVLNRLLNYLLQIKSTSRFSFAFIKYVGATFISELYGKADDNSEILQKLKTLNL